MSAENKTKAYQSEGNTRRTSKVGRRTETAPATAIVPESAAPLDPRLCALALDALTSLESFIVSRTAGLPYSALRDALRFEEPEREQIIGAAQAIAENHSDWVREHGGPAFFLITLTAAQIAKLDALLLARPDPDPPHDPREARQELLWGLLVIFLPALLFGLIFLLVKRGESK